MTLPARLLQEAALNNIGTPVLSLVSGFLKSNPAAAEAAKAFAGAPATQAFIKTVSGLAIGIGPAEKAALVRCCTHPALNPSCLLLMALLTPSNDSMPPMATSC